MSGGPSQTFTYDGWGNLTAKSGGQSFSLPIDPASNRIYGTGICYDPNGNLTGVQNGCGVDYGYDMSNRLVRATSTLGAPERYWYTADNKRVSTLKPAGTAMNGILQQLFYVYGARGELTTCYSKFFGSVPICTPTELKWAGRLIRRTIGFYNPSTSNNDRYSGVPVVTDRVGSVVGIGMGVSYEQSTQYYYPYGEGPATANTPQIGQSGFATYLTETNTGLSYADQRYYSSQFGRFMSADPYRGGVHLTDSQSWNKFSYGLNDPINHADPTGLCAIDGVVYPDGQGPCPNSTSTTIFGDNEDTDRDLSPHSAVLARILLLGKNTTALPMN